MTVESLATPTPARILVVDDHPAMREGLGIRISSQPDMEVCGEAADVPEALRLIFETNPDVVIVDISLKNGNGIDLIKQVKERDSKVRMLVLSMHNESLYAERSLRAGAVGYINKGEATEKVIDAIRDVLQGKVYLSDPAADRLLHRTVGNDIDASRSPVDQLSDRELEVFRFIGQGVQTPDIAGRLHVSPKTVETYRSRIKSKLGLTSAAELMRLAVHWELENA